MADPVCDLAMDTTPLVLQVLDSSMARHLTLFPLLLTIVTTNTTKVAPGGDHTHLPVLIHGHVAADPVIESTRYDLRTPGIMLRHVIRRPSPLSIMTTRVTEVAPGNDQTHLPARTIISICDHNLVSPAYDLANHTRRLSHQHPVLNMTHGLALFLLLLIIVVAKVVKVAPGHSQASPQVKVTMPICGQIADPVCDLVRDAGLFPHQNLAFDLARKPTMLLPLLPTMITIKIGELIPSVTPTRP
ncbi:hypothetical protein FRC07_000774 [Ceratobasidium sp. 392]|nr:hypothetical protein FRC07_000774 [Ceratobasidium sp. 392]